MRIEEEIKSHFDDEWQKAVVNILFTSHWIRDLHVTILKEHDLQPQHYNVLRIVKGSHPKPVAPGYIRDVMLDKGADVTRLLNKLEEKKYIHREICQSNRRMIDVHLTPLGVNFLEIINPQIQQMAKNMHKCLKRKDAELLSNLLDKLRG